MYNHIYRRVGSEYFENDAGILALDYYDSNSRGEDDFSRKQVWFYVYGDEDIKEEFEDRMTELFRIRFKKDDVGWDLATLMPTHRKDDINPQMQDLLLDVTSGIMDYNQILERTETISEGHDLKTDKERVLNLKNSLEVTQDVEDKNIVLMDNLSLSGFSMLYAQDKLLKAGANKVACVVLGLGKENKDIDFEGLSEEIGYSKLEDKIVYEDEIPRKDQ